MNHGVDRPLRAVAQRQGEGVSQDPGLPLLSQVQLAGEQEMVGEGRDTATSSRVMGKLAVLHTNYISNQPEKGAGINLPCGQLRESSWN